MKNRKYYLLTLLVLCLAGFSESGFQFGPINEIKKRIKDLKKHSETEEAKKISWKELDSQLSGSYSGNNKLITKNSPYILNGSVQFIDCNTEISAGVYVRGAAEESIRFEGGTLKILGSKSLPIVFTTENRTPNLVTNRGDWEGIVISECEADIDWAEFKFSKTGLKVTSVCDINNSIFEYNSVNGAIIGDTNSVSPYTVTLTNCVASNNSSAGVKITGPTVTAVIKYSQINNNDDNAVSILELNALTFRNNNVDYTGTGKLISNRDLDYTVLVSSNWWSTTSTTTIDTGMVDSSVNPGLYGPIVFEPILQSTVSTAGLE
ncbi:right-handed parallel beta-helix repeat-containing protein [Elusimicrobiota bacterium]